VSLFLQTATDDIFVQNRKCFMIEYVNRALAIFTFTRVVMVKDLVRFSGSSISS